MTNQTIELRRGGHIIRGDQSSHSTTGTIMTHWQVEQDTAQHRAENVEDTHDTALVLTQIQQLLHHTRASAKQVAPNTPIAEHTRGGKAPRLRRTERQQSIHLAMPMAIATPCHSARRRAPALAQNMRKFMKTLSSGVALSHDRSCANSKCANSKCAGNTGTWAA